MNTQIFQYNDNPVTFRLDNGLTYVSATEMAKPFGKRPNDYLSLPSTNELVKAITRKSGIAENQLIKINRGGLNPATWLHEDVALDFAQWLSVDFRLWCLDRLKELLKYGITATQPTIEAIIDDPDNAIKLLTALKQERAEKERLAEENRLANEQIEKAAPMVQYYNKVLQSDSLITTNVIADQLGVSARRLNDMLVKRGIIYRQSDTYVLYAKYRGQGYEGYRTHTYISSTTGQQFTKQHLYWTEKGREFIYNLFHDDRV